jgi:hypothetical protein
MGAKKNPSQNFAQTPERPKSVLLCFVCAVVIGAMNNTLPKTIAVLLMTSLTGCGTLFTGTTQTVQINSIPSGATVQVNGADRGQTPMPVTLKKGATGQMITLSKDGYEKNSFVPQTCFNPVSICNLVFILPWVIDACDGAMYKYDPDSYNIQLKKAVYSR